MKKIFLIILLSILTGCNKPKTVLICGDHVCVNKAEAKQYFEENLSLEVKIIDKKNKNKLDLIELNMRKTQNIKKKVFIKPKTRTNQKLKTLSKKEIDTIKQKIKNKEKDNLVKKTRVKKDDKFTMEKTKKTINNSKQLKTDVCKVLKECNIDEISKYLIKLGNKKKFPDITIRE